MIRRAWPLVISQTYTDPAWVAVATVRLSGDQAAALIPSSVSPSDGRWFPAVKSQRSRARRPEDQPAKTVPSGENDMLATLPVSARSVSAGNRANSLPEVVS